MLKVGLFILGFLLTLSSCKLENKEAPAAGGIAISNKDMQVQVGTYRTEVVEQTSYRDYNAKEKVFSEIIVAQDSVTYIAYRDNEVVNQKKGSYDVRAHAFLFYNEGTGENDKNLVAEVTPESFSLKYSRKLLHLKKVK